MQFTGKEIKVIQSAGRKTNSITERVMRYVLETVDRNSDTIKREQFRLWMRFFFLCLQKTEMLAKDLPFDIELKKEELLSVMGVLEGPDGELRVSLALFSSWIQEEMCKPVLEMIQELCVEQCNYVTYSGGLCSSRQFRDTIQSIGTQFVSFHFLLSPLFHFFVCCRMRKCLSPIPNTWLLGQACWPRTSKAGPDSTA